MLHTVLDIVLHLDQHLAQWSTAFGPSLYLILFAVIFCETGLVVTPFLPGDSLLFAIGALSALPGAAIQITQVTLLLMVAAILGDSLNYKLGHIFGRRAFAGQFRFISQKHLLRTKDFYDRHGGKAIVLARFAPVLRTFAPFVAGVGEMPYPRFLAFNVAGGIAWVGSFCFAGYQFGNIPAIKQRFHIVIIAIVVISLIPAVLEAVRARRADRDQPAA